MRISGDMLNAEGGVNSIILARKKFQELKNGIIQSEVLSFTKERVTNQLFCFKKG